MFSMLRNHRERGSLNLELALVIVLFILVAIGGLTGLAGSVGNALTTAANRIGIAQSNPGGGANPGGGTTPTQATIVADAAGSGSIISRSSSWNTALDGTAGFAVMVPTNRPDSMLASAFFQDPNYIVARSFMNFPIDRSTVNGSITAAELTITSVDTGTNSPDMIFLFAAAQGSPVGTGDFNSFSGVPLAVPISAWSGSAGPIVFTFNLDGLNYLNAAGSTAKFCLRSAKDVNNITPTDGNYGGVFSGATASDSTLKPSLSITYAKPSGSAADSIAPAQVIGLVATGGSSGISFSGYSASDNVGVDHYQLYWSTDQTAPAVDTAPTLDGIKTATVDAIGLSPSTAYYAWMRAADAAGNLGPWSSMVSATSGSGAAVPPSAVSGFQVSAGDARVDLSWSSAIAGTDPIGGYSVQRSDNGGTSYTVLTPSGLAADATSYADTTAVNGTTYLYTVTAYSTASEWGSSATALSATPQSSADTVPPTAPVLSSASFDGRVDLSWTASVDNVAVAGYGITRVTWNGSGWDAPTSFFVGPTETSYSDSTAVNGSTYNYNISAWDAVYNYSAWSNFAPGNPEAPAPTVVAPSKVTGLTGSAGDSSVNLQWDAALAGTNSIAGYDVQRFDTVSNAWTDLTPSGIGGTTYADSTAVNDTSYSYRVAAYDSGATSTWGDYSEVFDATPLAPMVIGSLSKSFSGTVIVRWTKFYDSHAIAAASYRIERSTSSDMSNPVVLVGSGTSTSLSTSGGYVAGVTYYFTVQALSPGSGFLSGPSSVISILYTSNQVTGLNATPGDNQAVLSWAPVVGATNYLVKYSAFANMSYAISLNVYQDGSTWVTTPGNLSNGYCFYNVTGLLPGTQYYFTVSAEYHNSFGTSSDVLPVSTLAPTVVPPG